ncbi:MAG: hypothetical protein RR269_07540, partial [Oscillospiraceae bacterium]
MPKKSCRNSWSHHITPFEFKAPCCINGRKNVIIGKLRCLSLASVPSIAQSKSHKTDFALFFEKKRK